MIQKNVPGSCHIFKEKHYKFEPLLDALDVYVHSFDTGNTWTWPQRDAHWRTIVGLAQHYAPAHVAQHYCNPDESFDPKNNNTPPTFDEKVLKRTLNFENWISDKTESWWPSSGVSGSNVLGLEIGILRAEDDAGAVGPPCGAGRVWCLGCPSSELAALTALCEMRTADVRELKQLLDSLQKPDAGLEAARCVVQ